MPNYDKLREQRAKIILSRENSVRKVNENIYLVQSQTGIGWYKVQFTTCKWICNCPAFTKHGHIEPCKHIIALETCLESLINPYVIEDEPVLEKQTYSQDWTLYNNAQIHEFEIFDQLLYQLVSTIEDQEQHMGRPRLKLNDKIFCCVMKVYSQLSGRRAHCLYQQASERQQITHAPHFNAISKTLIKKEITSLLYDLVRLSAKPLADIEIDFAIDSSGFRCSTFGNYCEEKHGIKRTRNWLKAHIITGVNTNIVVDVTITDEHSADSPQFKKLVYNTAQHFDINEVSADMAYSSRKNYEIADKLGGTAYIPFRKNARGTARGSALWKKAFHYFQLHRNEFEEHYHKRSNAESTFSAIKNKFGETIKSRNRVAQENEMLCKIIAYNITVLIHAMFELGITPDFAVPRDGSTDNITI